ncbi:MAG: hypothetical protein JRJ56_00600 [Deltaproteobacteria bacterium]|nr:hypothetical protein [Deltaproteobacteria bacterium]
MANSEKAGCGIAGLGFYLPAKKVPVLELAARAGIPEFVARFVGAETVREAEPAMLPTDMAIRAAAAALENAGLGPEEIDLIIYCGAGLGDYILPPSAGRIQDGIKAKNAACFDLGQGCGGMLTGLEVARGQLALGDGCETVLLVTGDKWSAFTEHHAADAVFFGDGGGAVIVRRGHQRLQPLTGHQVARGEYHDLWGIRAGGLRHPASAATVAANEHLYRCLDPQRARHEFKEIYLAVMLATVRETLEKAGLRSADIAYFSMVNANLKVQELLLEQLEIPLARSSAAYLRQYGHFGSQDIFFNLDLAIRDGRLQPGDLIVMLTTGIGFSWVCSLIRY